MKFRVELGSLVTKLMHRTYIVSAKSEEEAKEKAESRFRNVCKNAKEYIDCGDTVIVDFVERVGD